MAKKRVVQHHHIFYETRDDKTNKLKQREFTVPLYQGEHYIVTQIQRLNPENCSKGFVTACRALLEIIDYSAHVIED